MAQTRDPSRLRADGKAAVENSVHAMFARALGTPRFSCSSVAILTPFMQYQQHQQQQAGPVSSHSGQQTGPVSALPSQQAGPVSAPPHQQTGDLPAAPVASGGPPPTALTPGGRLMLLTTVRYKQPDPPQPPPVPEPPSGGQGAFGSPLGSSLAPSSITPSSTFTGPGWHSQGAAGAHAAHSQDIGGSSQGADAHAAYSQDLVSSSQDAGTAVASSMVTGSGGAARGSEVATSSLTGQALGSMGTGRLGGSIVDSARIIAVSGGGGAQDDSRGGTADVYGSGADSGGVASSGNGARGGRAVVPEAVEDSGAGVPGGDSEADAGGAAEHTGGYGSKGSTGAIDGGSGSTREPTVKSGSLGGGVRMRGGDAAAVGGIGSQGPAGIMHGSSSGGGTEDASDDDDDDDIGVGSQAMERGPRNRGRVWLGSHAAGGRIARGEPPNLPLTVGPHAAAPSAPMDYVVVAPDTVPLSISTEATEGQQPSGLSSTPEEGQPGAQAVDMLHVQSPDLVHHARSPAVSQPADAPDTHLVPPPPAVPVPQPPVQQTAPLASEHPAFPSPARVHRIGTGACDALLRWLVRHFISRSVPNAMQVSENALLVTGLLCWSRDRFSTCYCATPGFIRLHWVAYDSVKGQLGGLARLLSWIAHLATMSCCCSPSSQPAAHNNGVRLWPIYAGSFYSDHAPTSRSVKRSNVPTGQLDLRSVKFPFKYNDARVK